MMNSGNVTLTIEDGSVNATDDRNGYMRSWKKENKSRVNVSRSRSTYDKYLRREFIAWDGEGYNHGDEHRYAILANSVGDVISDENGLSTLDCFHLILDTECRKDAIHVIYGGGYDFNMMLRDMPRELLQELYDAGTVEWEGFKVTWRIGKSLRITDGERKRVIYDVLPFFQTSFVKACDSYLGTDWYMRDQIIADKARRGNFTWEEINAGVKEYNAAELVNLVDLANELRVRLDRVGIRINRWDGPGAVAVSLFQNYRVKDYMAEQPELIRECAQYAYAGGRFEILQQGDFGPVYEYDLNSAYPHAIQNLPCLVHGEWVQGTTVGDFGVYRIRAAKDEWTDDEIKRPFPLWHRNPDGTIVYMAHDNWYWTPEARLVENDDRYEFIDGWTWKPACDDKPFRWVGPMYNKRAALKKAGDGAHVGLKLGLNSLYGKLAQQIGARLLKDGTWRIPPYHCLEWAGYVTSSCRAMVYQAASQNVDAIIAFETDAVFSTRPLDLPLSSRLGEWEETVFESLTYVKSGFYYGTINGEEIERSRGFNRGTVTRDKVRSAMRENTICIAEHTQFVTLGAALHTMGWERWRAWLTREKRISTVYTQGCKRMVNPLDLLTNARQSRRLYPGLIVGDKSTRYNVAWVDEKFYDSDESVMGFKRGSYDESEQDAI